MDKLLHAKLRDKLLIYNGTRLLRDFGKDSSKLRQAGIPHKYAPRVEIGVGRTEIEAVAAISMC